MLNPADAAGSRRGTTRADPGSSANPPSWGGERIRVGVFLLAARFPGQSHGEVLSATVNAAIEGFVRAAATELPRGLRINAVSATLLTESLDAYGPYFPGFEAVPGERVGQVYRRSVEGVGTGRIYTLWQ